MIELVLGGARSGKSRYAEHSAQALNAARHVYVATAQALDTEMTARIQHHQRTRNACWQLLESPLALATTLREIDHADHVVVVDCLTLWMTNLLLQEASVFAHERDALLDVLPQLRARIYLVSNETGMGIVPMDALTRRFVDETGRLHQQLAALCDHVTLVVAGIPMTVKSDKQ